MNEVMGWEEERKEDWRWEDWDRSEENCKGRRRKDWEEKRREEKRGIGGERKRGLVGKDWKRRTEDRSEEGRGEQKIDWEGDLEKGRKRKNRSEEKSIV